MDSLFGPLGQSIDFLVLGAVATLALCLPFGFKKPLQDGWCWLKSLMEGSHHLVQGGLLTVFLFSAFYFSGYLLNAAGHAVLHRAHFMIIQTVADTKLAAKNDSGMPSGFLWRAVPFNGYLHLSPTADDEVQSYWDDARRQFYWEVCDMQSSNDMLDGGALSELRLLRGAVGLTWILLVVCAVSFFLPLCVKHKLDKQSLWSASTAAAVLVLYFVLIVPCYWDAEYEEHSTIWAGFPKDLDPLALDKMDQVLPCRKMRVVAEGRKNEQPKLVSPAGPSNGQ